MLCYLKVENKNAVSVTITFESKMTRKGNLFKNVTADVLERTITNTSLVLDSTSNCELLYMVTIKHILYLIYLFII